MNQPNKSTGFNRVILIPTDFSAIAELAMVHGLELAERLHCRVCFLHVHDNKTGTADNSEDADYKKALQDLLKCKEAYGQKYPVGIDLMIREGNLFKAVNTVVAEIKPWVMVMGTHGKQGLQLLFGSHALRVVLDSPCPVMVVQESFPETGYRRIMVPVKTGVDPGQLTEWALLMQKLFDTEIHVFQSREITAERENLIKGISSQITRVFKEKKVSYNIKQAESPDDFSGQVIAFANTNRCDLIMTMTMPAADATGFHFSDWNERLMFNPGRVPVMFIDLADPAG
jgi:nucleotide-binding universal stress UspA family protein